MNGFHLGPKRYCNDSIAACCCWDPLALGRLAGGDGKHDDEERHDDGDHVGVGDHPLRRAFGFFFGELSHGNQAGLDVGLLAEPRGQEHVELLPDHARIVARLDRQHAANDDLPGQQFLVAQVAQFLAQGDADQVGQQGAVERADQGDGHRGTDRVGVFQVSQHEDQAQQRGDHAEGRSAAADQFDDLLGLAVPRGPGFDLVVHDLGDDLRPRAVDRQLDPQGDERIADFPGLASRASSPSLRANSANCTSSLINSDGSSSRLRNGFLRMEKRFCNCREGKPMSVTAAAPPKTISRAGGSMNVLSEASVLPRNKTPLIAAKPRISPRIVVHSIPLARHPTARGQKRAVGVPALAGISPKHRLKAGLQRLVSAVSDYISCESSAGMDTIGTDGKLDEDGKPAAGCVFRSA